MNKAVRILVVDDEMIVREALSNYLREDGYEAVAVETGAEALRKVEGERWNVLFVDLKMPGMDGLEVLSYIKRSFPGIEVVLLSGHPSVEAAMKGVKLGASEYLNKPPDIDELEETVKKLHQRRKQWQLEQQQKLIDDIRRRYPD